MLKFFRRIRRKWLDKNNYRKYSVYAAGEIALIIIGVLIALSISEWNENRKAKSFIREMLAEIQTELSLISDILKDRSNNLDKRIDKIVTLDSLLKEEIPQYTPSLDTLFGAVWGLDIFRFERISYDNLKSTGLNLIENEFLRRQLTRVFEYGHRRAAGIAEDEGAINDNVSYSALLHSKFPFF